MLKAVLEYTYGGERHPQSQAFYEVIKAERTTFEFAEDRLESLLQLNEDYLRITEYLGTRTWFWKISVNNKNASLIIILAVLPPIKDEWNYPLYRDSQLSHTF